MRDFYTGAQRLGLREALGTVFQRGFRGVADLLKQVRFQIKIQFAGFSFDLCSWLCRLTGAEQCCPLQAERHPPVARPRAAPSTPPTPPPPPTTTSVYTAGWALGQRSVTPLSTLGPSLRE